jgi:hypothetical protein
MKPESEKQKLSKKKVWVNVKKRNRRTKEAMQKLYATYRGLKVGECARCHTVVGQIAIEYNHLPSYKKSKNVSTIHNLDKYWEELLKTEQLCIDCHCNYTYRMIGLQIQREEYNKYTPKGKISKEKIVNKKNAGCICCGKMPHPDNFGTRVFVLDHKYNNDKSDWFKEIRGFNIQHKSFCHEKLDEELAKCQVLCLVCNKIKTYLERRDHHTIQKHNDVHTYYANVLNWFKLTYKDDKELIKYLSYGRGVDDTYMSPEIKRPNKRRKLES